MLTNGNGTVWCEVFSTGGDVVVFWGKPLLLTCSFRWRASVYVMFVLLTSATDERREYSGIYGASATDCDYYCVLLS